MGSAQDYLHNLIVFVIGVNQENNEAGGVQDSLVQPQRCKTPKTELLNINDGVPLRKKPTA